MKFNLPTGEVREAVSRRVRCVSGWILLLGQVLHGAALKRPQCLSPKRHPASRSETVQPPDQQNWQAEDCRFRSGKTLSRISRLEDDKQSHHIVVQVQFSLFLTPVFRSGRIVDRLSCCWVPKATERRLTCGAWDASSRSSWLEKRSSQGTENWISSKRSVRCWDLRQNGRCQGAVDMQGMTTLSTIGRSQTMFVRAGQPVWPSIDTLRLRLPIGVALTKSMAMPRHFSSVCSV